MTNHQQTKFFFFIFSSLLQCLSWKEINSCSTFCISHLEKNTQKISHDSRIQHFSLQFFLFLRSKYYDEQYICLYNEFIFAFNMNLCVYSAIVILLFFCSSFFLTLLPLHFILAYFSCLCTAIIKQKEIVFSLHLLIKSYPTPEKNKIFLWIS